MNSSIFTFEATSDELAFEIMVWLNSHPKAKGIETLTEAIHKLGFKIEEIEHEPIHTDSD